MRPLNLSRLPLAILTSFILLPNISSVTAATVGIENVVWADDCDGDRNVRTWYSPNGNTTLISLFKGAVNLRINVDSATQQGDLYNFTYSNSSTEQYKKVDNSTILLQSRVISNQKYFENGVNVKTGAASVPVKLCSSDSYASKKIDSVIKDILASIPDEPEAIQLNRCSIIFTRLSAKFLGMGDIKSSQNAAEFNKKIDKLATAKYGSFDKFVNVNRSFAPQFTQWLNSQPESTETQLLKECIAITKSK